MAWPRHGHVKFTSLIRLGHGMVMSWTDYTHVMLLIRLGHGMARSWTRYAHIINVLNTA